MVDKQQNAKGSEEESDALSLDELSGVAGGTGPGAQPLPPMPGESMPGGVGMAGFDAGAPSGGGPGDFSDGGPGGGYGGPDGGLTWPWRWLWRPWWWS